MIGSLIDTTGLGVAVKYGVFPRTLPSLSVIMASSPGVSSAPPDETPSLLPKFMPPVTLTSLTPHPYLPFEPSKSQFIIPPPAQEDTVRAPAPDSIEGATSTPSPKNILAATKAGNLEWVKRYSAAGQTEMTDNMGEVHYG